ncbi:MAG: hypothetical protein ACRD4J_10350 [Nitrososphaeraceae archaeon]
MVERETLIVQILSSAVAAILALTGINTFINDFFYQPNLSIDTKTNASDPQVNDIIIRNSGTEAATKLVITVEAPGIVQNRNIFSTENIKVTEYPKIDNNTLQIYVSRLVQGEGSFVRIESVVDDKSSTESNPLSSNYSVYATYDQGSITNTAQLQTSVPYWIPLLLILASAVASIFAWSVRKTGLEKKLKSEREEKEALKEALKERQEEFKKARTDFLLAALKFLTVIRRELLKNIMSRELSFESSDGTDILKLLKRSQEAMLRPFSKSVTSFDYVLMDDFIDKYSERQTLLRQNQLNEDQLKKTNKECLDLVKQLLVKVDGVKVSAQYD